METWGKAFSRVLKYISTYRLGIQGHKLRKWPRSPRNLVCLPNILRAKIVWGHCWTPGWLSPRKLEPIFTKQGCWVTYELWHPVDWLKLQRQKASEGWKVFTEQGHNVLRLLTTWFLSLLAFLLSSWLRMLQMHSSPLSSTRLVSERERDLPSLSVIILFSWHPAHYSFYLDPITWHHRLPSFLFLLCIFLDHLTHQSPSCCHLQREQSSHFP